MTATMTIEEARQDGEDAPTVPTPSHVYCTNCGRAMHPVASRCLACDVPRLAGEHFCWQCRSTLGAVDDRCVECGARTFKDVDTGRQMRRTGSKRVVAGVTAIVAGALGIHKFVVGDARQGLTRLAITVLVGIATLGLGAGVMIGVGIVEGVTYLSQSDADFVRIYQVGTKDWF